MINHCNEVEQLCMDWKQALGQQYQGYKNHIYRVINLCALQRSLSEKELRQVVIAASFHDVAIWLDDTFDYLTPSRKYATSYLESQGLEAYTQTVGEMIEQHHKFTRHKGAVLGEIFRRADWCDVTLGTVRFGIDPSAIKAIRTAFPNAGFHPFLLRRAARELLSRPWNPLPMLRW